jgi:hypothetical protein
VKIHHDALAPRPPSRYTRSIATPLDTPLDTLTLCTVHHSLLSTPLLCPYPVTACVIQNLLLCGLRKPWLRAAKEYE